MSNMDDLDLTLDPFEKREPSVEEKIDALAQQPLVSTGKPPSPESVAEAKRIAALANPIPPPTPPPPPTTETGEGGVEMDPLAHGSIAPSTGSPSAVSVDADPDEEPPEPEGHGLQREVSDWLAANGGQEFFHGPLPADIAAIWGHPTHRAADEATARILVATWGLDGFRSSALHQAALSERARTANSAEVTSRFKAEREQKKAKGR